MDDNTPINYNYCYIMNILIKASMVFREQNIKHFNAFAKSGVVI